MAGRSLLPFFSRNWSLSRSSEDTDPFMAFRRQMNRVFDDAFRGFGMPSLVGPAFGRDVGPLWRRGHQSRDRGNAS